MKARTTPAAEARELRRRAEELRMRAEHFKLDGLPRFAADALRLRHELYAEADRLDPRGAFVPGHPERFLPERGGAA